MTELANRGYAHPDALVSTEWVAEHSNDSNVRIVESNEDPLLYSSGHVPGAIEIDWAQDLNDPLRRDYLDQKGFQDLMSRKGISNDTTVVFYGDKNNWWACYAFWVFQLFGHTNAVISLGTSRMCPRPATRRPHETTSLSGHSGTMCSLT